MSKTQTNPFALVTCEYVTDVVYNDVPDITPSSPPASIELVRENKDLRFDTADACNAFEVDPLNCINMPLEACPTRYQQDRGNDLQTIRQAIAEAQKETSDGSSHTETKTEN